MRTTRETFGKTNQQILDIYTSQLNNLVKEKGKIIKIPGTIFYGDNMVISGDTAAYLKGDAEYPIKFYKPKNVVFGVVKGIHYPSLDLENVEFASTDGLIESEMDNNYNLNLANAILNKEHFIKELDVLTEFDGTTWEIESETDFNKFKPNQEKRTFVVNDDITLIKVDDVFKNYLKGEFLEAVPFEYSTENIFLEDLPQYFEGKVFDVVETAVYEQKISGLMSEVNKLIGEIRQSSSMQDKQQLERLMGNFLAVIKQIQEETTDSGTFRNDLREEAVEVTLKKLNGLDYNSKLNIVNAVEEYNKQNVFNEVNVDIIKQFLEVQNVDELIARLKDATIC